MVPGDSEVNGPFSELLLHVLTTSMYSSRHAVMLSFREILSPSTVAEAGLFREIQKPNESNAGASVSRKCDDTFKFQDDVSKFHDHIILSVVVLVPTKNKPELYHSVIQIALLVKVEPTVVQY